MKLKKLINVLCVSGSIWVLVINSAIGETQETQPQKQEDTVTRLILRLSKIPRPATTADKLVQSPAAPTANSSEVVQVTGVKANPTDKGVEVVLQTTKGQELQVVNRSLGNSYIVDVPNAQPASSQWGGVHISFPKTSSRNY